MKKQEFKYYHVVYPDDWILINPDFCAQVRID